MAELGGRGPEDRGGTVKMVTEKIFEAALSISTPWYIAGMSFEESQRKLMIRVDFELGSRFAVAGHSGEHPVHDTVSKT